jgi:hypothetical protein
MELKMSWGRHIQSGNLQEIDNMGSQLSIQIDCPVHFPAFNKSLFECKHGVIIPTFMVKGAILLNDWSQVIRKHDKEQRMVEDRNVT